MRDAFGQEAWEGLGLALQHLICDLMAIKGSLSVSRDTVQRDPNNDRKRDSARTPSAT